MLLLLTARGMTFKGRHIEVPYLIQYVTSYTYINSTIKHSVYHSFSRKPITLYKKITEYNIIIDAMERV